ncbi:hypothetical protein DXT66_17505 [Nocardia farcinica]|nr:hypothetical protein DXT66_17505 [Nocardia farcinica]
MPFGSAVERRSRTTYRPTVTPQGSTHVDSFTGYHLLVRSHGPRNVAARDEHANIFSGAIVPVLPAVGTRFLPTALPMIPKSSLI